MFKSNVILVRRTAGQSPPAAPAEAPGLTRITEEFDAQGRVVRRTVTTDRERSTEEIDALRAKCDATTTEADRVMEEATSCLDKMARAMDDLFKDW